MEFDELKTSWSKAADKPKTHDDIQSMLQENRHPVLKEIRTQIFIEVIGMSVFLAVFYSIFDGDKKPLVINLMLVMATLAIILHHVYGYYLNRKICYGQDLATSLQVYLNKLKYYILFSLLFRVIFLIGLGLFFGYGIKLNNFKLACTIIIALVFCIQLLSLYRIWNKRLSEIGKTLASLRSEM